MARCSLHEQKRILGHLWEQFVGRHISTKKDGESLYEYLTQDRKIHIPKGMTAKMSSKVTVSDYRGAPTLSGNEDDKLLLCFGDCVDKIVPSSVGSNDAYRRKIARTMRAYAMHKTAVHTLADGGAKWPTKASLKRKFELVSSTSRALGDNIKLSTNKVIPHTHDMVKHNTLYLKKDAHTRNAEGQEAAGKKFKNSNTNGKAKDTTTTLMRRQRAAEDALVNIKPSPHTQHAKAVIERGARFTPVKYSLPSSPSSTSRGSSNNSNRGSSSNSR